MTKPDSWTDERWEAICGHRGTRTTNSGRAERAPLPAERASVGNASAPAAIPPICRGHIARGTHRHAQCHATRPRLWCRYASVALDL
jgi:hypothetical protein